MSKFACIIMASGEGKRFGGNKLMANLNGMPMIGYVLDATEGMFEKRIVVTRHEDVEHFCKEQKVECILHDLPNRNDTIRLGMEGILATGREFSHIFFFVGDQPYMKKSSIEKMISVAKENPGSIVRAGFGDKVGSPVAFPKGMFEELMNLPEKEGGRFLIKKNNDKVKVVQVSEAKELFDIDYKEDLL